MKYIIFKKGFQIIPVILSDDAVHCLVSVGEGFKPISAGFFWYNSSEVVIDTDRISESLGIGPNPEKDKRFLDLLLSGFTGSVFLDFED